MYKALLRTIIAIILSIIIASCGKVETIQLTPTEEMQTTPTAFVTPTVPPTISPIITPSITPYPTTPAEATIAAFDSLCIGAKEIMDSEISPNGKWIAATCYWENGKEESPLQAVSIDGSKEWKIYFNDYGFGDRHDRILPYRWSKDEKFLYAVAYSRISGCCWIGGKFNLLVRLNLETGEQTAMINGAHGSDPTFSFTISENDHFLLSTYMSNLPYDFTVLDLLSGKMRVVNLEESKPIDLEFAIMSPYEDIIVLPLFRHIEFNDYVVESILLINLKSDEQRVLISELQEGEELYPIRWMDKEHVLLCNTNPFAYQYPNDHPMEYWRLNINTGERVKVDKL